MKRFFKEHLKNCVASLGVISRQAVGSVLTVAVIGVALALPSALNLIVQNGRTLAGGWETIRDFSVYLQPGSSLDDAGTLARDLESQSTIREVVIVTADEALADFQHDAGFGAAIEALDGNPLPHTLIVRPDDDATPNALAALAQRLSERPDVDQVKLDTEWVARLNAILDLVRRGVWIAAVLLLGAVIIIIGNTIRLDIQNRRAEIEVSKLLGATDAFVRRPFLYLGFWYGLFGGLFALVLLVAGITLLSGPVERLAGLYGGSFSIAGLDGNTAVMVLAGGMLAGCGGAWTAVARHLSVIQPRV